mmetsp:Transcript_23788/g.68062  ORF Transcript_23788/g.68062 Transcript_23788/m.68062 type:complete len:222 (+) Transcript_23788:1024-1689(+)
MEDERQVKVLQELLNVALDPALALVESLSDTGAAESPCECDPCSPHEGGGPAEAVDRRAGDRVFADAAIHETVRLLQCWHEEGSVCAPEVDQADGIESGGRNAPVVLVGLVHGVVRAKHGLHVGACLRADHETSAPIRSPSTLAVLEHGRQELLQHVTLRCHVGVEDHHETDVLLHHVPQCILQVPSLEVRVATLHATHEPHEGQPLCSKFHHRGTARGHL